MKNNTKNVGILTFHRAANYGAALQTYALQTAISRMSPLFDVSILDYRSLAIELSYNPNWMYSARNSIRTMIKHLIRYPTRRRHREVFNDFIYSKLKMTQEITREILVTSADKFDYIIAGSDQIWNPQITQGDTTYFLDFAQNLRRIAYSASFGSVEFNESQLPFFRHYLSPQRWSNISVREKSAAVFLEFLTGQKVPVTLDPTLLLNQSDWSAIAQFPTSLLGKRYILIYNMVPTNHLIKFARDLAFRTGCALQFLGNSFKYPLGVTKLRAMSPSEFLGLFQNAEYVVCNSFHGTAFAINFERPFFTETTDAKGKINTRVQNILEITGLENRALQKGKFSGDPSDRNNIDWAAVRARLSAEREHSRAYLRSALGV